MLRYPPDVSEFRRAKVGSGQYQRLIVNRVGLITLQRRIQLHPAGFRLAQWLEVRVCLKQLGLQAIQLRTDVIDQAEPDRVGRLACCVPLGEQGVLHLFIGFDLGAEQVLNVIGV